MQDLAGQTGNSFDGFIDRKDAGRVLAGKLEGFAFAPDTVVLALPRGGVPVAFEVARELHLPLDILVVRKLGVPGHEELAFGAIASGGVLFVNRSMIASLRLTGPVIDRTIELEKSELERRERVYRGDRPALDVHGKTVILVDDGLATGASMRVAIEAVRKQGPYRIVVAVPVAASQVCDEFKQDADQWCVCVLTPEPFYAVGLWYADFSPTTDEEVHDLLSRADLPQQVASPTVQRV